MSEPRKKPGAAFWASVVVVVGLSCPISFVPAAYLSMTQSRSSDHVQRTDQ